MRLKRLEALGFKSFANKTTVLFDAHSKEGERPKIIGIVGPNGCGKSNVVDALLWILGEQSFRELRAKTKEDIIFAGTDTEAPHSMAEVSIVLGLEPGEGAKISPDFNDASEVMMTRRIYRSGESEFLINKQPCRLQDISSFFLDTGAGQGSYSIISQGQIDSLIQSKPEEKRQLIEEASGIASFRIQRRRAFMKLESTQENLNRIKDIIKEVESQLKSLKKYAERAQRYKQAREELRDIDLALAAKTYSELKEQLEQLKIQFETISKNEEEKSKGFEENVKAIFQKEGFIAEEREKHSQNQELLLQESTLLEKKKGDLNFKTSKFNDISQNAETLTKQYKKIQDRKDGLTKQINLLEVEIKNLDEQVHIVKQTLSSDINLENIPHQIKLKKQQIKDLRERNVEGLLKIKTKESQVEGILKEVIGIQEEIKN
ncbi:MAG TPA: AAA family ATPase, partial [Bdellovibrionota bacterium]|nr:AAA family ATPase [Bdellovibrionota bacterium]